MEYEGIFLRPFKKYGDVGLGRSWQTNLDAANQAPAFRGNRTVVVMAFAPIDFQLKIGVIMW